MMFGAWGNTDHDESIRIIHRALDAGINFVDTADVYARGESEEIVGKALDGPARHGRARDEGARHDGDDDPNQRGNSRRWIVQRGREQPAPAADRLDRPLPDPPLGSRDRSSTRRSARSPTSSARARSATSARRRSRPSQIVEAQWVAERRGLRALRLRAAALLDPRPRHRGRGAARLRAVRHGRDPVEPARRRLADAAGTARAGRRRPAAARAAHPRALRPLAARRTSASSTPPSELALLAERGGHQR